MKLLRGFVFLFVLAVTGPALADIELYAGVGIGASDAAARPASLQSALVAKGYNVTNVSVDSDDSGWRFLTGLRFTDIWAFELGFVDLGDVKTTVDGNILPTQAGQFAQDVANALPVMPRGITLAAVGRFRPSKSEKFSLAVKFGVIDADAERKAGSSRGSDSVDADPYYGLAVGWDFSDNWRGVAGFEVFNMADSTVYWSAGLEYKFPSH